MPALRKSLSRQVRHPSCSPPPPSASLAEVQQGSLFCALYSTTTPTGNLPCSKRDPTSEAYGKQARRVKRVVSFASRLPDEHPSQSLPQTPLYDSLTTNLPHPVMCFQEYPFPPATPIFPIASRVQSCLESYAAHFDLMPHIKLNSTVLNLRWNSTQSQWAVTLTNADSVLFFDRVIVANGHHNIPRYPEIPGVEEWLSAKRASHSMWYRRPTALGDKVLVIGGGPSGTDISAELRQVCTTVVRSLSGGVNEECGNVKTRGRTVKLGENGQVHFADGSVESDIDYCILATGYQVSLPFIQLASGLPPPCPPLPSELFNSTYHLFPLAKHLFPIQSAFPPTSIAFMGLPVRVAPLPVMEAQAAAIIRVFNDPCALDIPHESQRILARYAELHAQTGGNQAAIARLWSIFSEKEQFDYQDELFEFAGLPQRVPQWRKDMYAAKGLLRAFWIELERRGEAERWVDGVGGGGIDEWAKLLQKLLQSAREWDASTR
ncbi:hypothetical protein MKEN_00433800 [Mycena kentingensis (nom. inval.)]|nr:hypothetical protein MKEN_00433800 [Mycena kentingensis (nom. inval.)]